MHVLLVNANGVDVRLSEPREKDEEKKPFSLTPPIDLLLDSLDAEGRDASLATGRSCSSFAPPRRGAAGRA